VLHNLRTYFTKGNTFYGLEVYQTGNAVKFHLLEVAKKKGELLITNSHSFEELQMLPDFAKSSVPIYLIYNTDNVITKQAESESGFKDKEAVEQLFPGLNFEIFLYQISKLGDLSYVSVAKKQDVEHCLAQLKEMKLMVAGFSIGPSSLDSIAHYIGDKLISTNTCDVRLKESSDSNLATTKMKNETSLTYNINGLDVKNAEVVAFSGILNFLTGSNKTISNFNEAAENLKNEFENGRVFRILLRSSLIFILLLLLLNFLFFSFYFDRVQLSQENLAFENENKKNLTLVQTRVDEKEKKVDALSSLSNSRTSFYLDRLGVTVPKSILLTELLYQPLTKPMHESKPIQLDENKILVMGTCMNSEDFSSWVMLLEKIEWIGSVETMDYDYQNKNSSNFKIKISVAKF
jgi:hypothetical protein